ncbi:MAG: thymidine phosphorylase [Microbacteriaceae bacterium]
MSGIEPFDAVDLIKSKRDAGELTTDEIRWLVDAYVRGVVADEQMSAMTMAILIRGMNRREINDLTAAMVASGERLDFSGLSWPTADKHSTGGVGDKITLPLAPLVASFGVAVPQLSGRGLGHTGGTLDKFESIPGWRANLSNVEMHEQLEQIGAVVCAAGSGLAPADRKLYALRDTTGTVEAIPLIASSIMSKKLAEGTGVLVLDVKFGNGAFMSTLDRAQELAEVLVGIGNDAGVKTRAVLSNMNTPLGFAIGNANEVRESVEVLAGGGPSDVIDLTVTLAEHMLELAGVHGADVRANLSNGKAMDVWRAMVSAQGGDPDAALPVASETHVVTADRDGIITHMDALPFGIGAWRMGAGRARKEDAVVHAAGIDLHVKPGDAVKAGDPVFTLSANDAARFDRALDAVDGAWGIGESVVDHGPLIAGIVGE